MLHDGSETAAIGLTSDRATAENAIPEPASSTSTSKPFLWIFLSLAVPWLILMVAIPPSVQNFPLNDDWAFGKGLFAFYEGRGIHYQGWASMPLLGQWIWALPFVALSRTESFVVLRISTLCLSFCGLMAFYDLLRQQAASARAALFTTVALAWSPYYFILSGTYMTDVPSLAFSMIALALFGRALSSESRWLLLASTVVAVLGALTRQNTVMVPLAMGVLLWRRPSTRRQVIWWLSAALPMLVAVAAHFWMQGRHDTVPRSLGAPNWLQALLFPYLAVHFLGIFVVPVLVASSLRRCWKIYLASLIVLSSIAGAIYYESKHGAPLPAYFPYLDIWLPEAYQVQGYFNPPLYNSTAVRIVLTILGCLGGAGLVSKLIEFVRMRPEPGGMVIFSLFELLLLLASPILYDRYLFALVPGALLIVGVGLSDAGGRWRIGVAALAVAGIICLGLMHDWLTTNAVRWELGRWAEKHGVSPVDVEGGLEWDGWFSLTDSRWHASSEDPSRKLYVKGLNLPFTQLCFPDLTGLYAISFSPYEGTMLLKQQSYFLWLTPGRRECYLVRVPRLPDSFRLRRNAPATDWNTPQQKQLTPASPP